MPSGSQIHPLRVPRAIATTPARMISAEPAAAKSISGTLTERGATGVGVICAYDVERPAEMQINTTDAGFMREPLL